MRNIKNKEKINKLIDSFTWKNCYEITDFKYYLKTSSESNFDAIIMYRNPDGSIFELEVRFANTDSLTLSMDNKTIQLSLFEVLDVSDDGWCNSNFWIRDLERENINFYCNEVVILRVSRFI